MPSFSGYRPEEHQMPCCGLHEYRRKVPLKYVISGGLVFWGTFLVGLIFGVTTVWSARGRLVLRVQAQFLQSLWTETMRHRDSIPARWSCRLSGHALRVSPGLAEIIYRHPELPFIYVPLTAAALLITGGVWLVRSL
jgi:hypothetical protein